VTHVVVQAMARGPMPSRENARQAARRLAAFQAGLEATGAVTSVQFVSTGVTLHVSLPVPVHDVETACEVTRQVAAATAERVGLPPWEWTTTGSVVDVDPAALLDLAAVADRLGTTPSIASRWADLPSFPTPAGTIAGVAMWDADTIDDFSHRTGVH